MPDAAALVRVVAKNRPLSAQLPKGIVVGWSDLGTICLKLFAKGPGLQETQVETRTPS